MSITLTGELLIGKAGLRGSAGEMFAIDPVADSPISPAFGLAGTAEIERVCRIADRAFPVLSRSSPVRRARLLEAIALRIDASRDELGARMAIETGLPLERIQHEQASLLELYRRGKRAVAAASMGYPHGRNYPLGPIAIFTGHYFSLCSSVAGLETMAALAAGCPIVALSHRCYPGTSELLGRAIRDAAADVNLPASTFSMMSVDQQTALTLVSHRLIRGVALTYSGGNVRALMECAHARREAIPVFGGRYSVNAAYVLPHALNARAEEIAHWYAQQLCDAGGQARLKSAVLVAQDAQGYIDLRESLGESLSVVEAAPVNVAVHAAYTRGVARCMCASGVVRIAEGRMGTGRWQAQALMFEIDAQALLTQPDLINDVLGPIALLVRCKGYGQMLDVARHFGAQLATSLQMDEPDATVAAPLLRVLERTSTRIVVGRRESIAEPNIKFDIESSAPLPDGDSCLIATNAIGRYLRPVCHFGAQGALFERPIR